MLANGINGYIILLSLLYYCFAFKCLNQI